MKTKIVSCITAIIWPLEAMKISTLAVSVVLALAPSSAPAGVFFTNETAFVAEIQPNYYLENLNGWTYGSPLGGTNSTDITTNYYTAPGSQGFDWTASALFDGTNQSGLFSLSSALSVTAGGGRDVLTITFTNNPVTAIGGIVANTEFYGSLSPGTVSMITSDGGSNSMVFATAAQGFLGYISSVPITSITLSANDFIAVGHFYTGASSSASPPPLTITPFAANVILSWPTNAIGFTFTLQSTTNLGSLAVWSTNLPSPAVVNGQNTVTNSISGRQRFYRLSQ
jgi:hypothetical protein